MELASQEHLFETSFLKSSVSRALLDSEGRILRVNAAWENEEVVAGAKPGQSILEFWHDLRAVNGIYQEYAQGLQEVLAGAREVGTVEHPVPAPEGMQWQSLEAIRLPGGVLLSLKVIPSPHQPDVLSHNLQKFFELSSDIMCIADPSGYLRVVSTAFEKTLGYSSKDLLARPFMEFVHPADRTATHAEFANLAQGSSTFDFENRYRTADGTYRTLQWRARAAGPGEAIYAIARDITGLRRITTLMEETSRVARIGGWELDFITGEVYWTAEMYRIHETTPEEYTPDVESGLRFYAAEYLDIIANILDRARKFGESWDLELQLITKQGRRIWVRGQGEVEFDGDRAIKAFGSLQDIDWRKRAELQFQALTNNVPGMIFQFRLSADGSMSFPFVSEGCRRICGLAPEDIMENAALITDVVHPDDRSAFEQSLIESARTMQPWVWEGRVVLSDGSIRYLQGQSTPGTDPQETGAIIWDGLLLDMTARSQAEQDLGELQHDLIRAGDTERRRIGRDLHDSLGQQITGISYLVDVLHDRLSRLDLPDEAKRAEKIRRLLGDSLETTRSLARGLSPVAMDSGGLETALMSLCESVQILFGIECVLDAGDSPERVDQEIATNLYYIATEAVTNARRHGQAKKIRIELTDGDHMLYLRIENDGMPLNPASERYDDRAGMGMRTMRYRAGLIGGELRIEPGSPGMPGPRIVVDAPLL